MSSDDFVGLPTRRITWLYILALSLVALLTLTGQSLVQWSLSALQGDSTTVNIAGRQRMLSQRIPRIILALGSDGNEKSHAVRPEKNVSHSDSMVDELERSLNVWRNNHLGLVHGSIDVGMARANSQPIQELFSKIDTHFKGLEGIASASIQRYRDANKELISPAERWAMLEHSDGFLTSMDAIVAQYELESKQRVSRLKWMERGLLIATLFVLVCEGLFIFSPAIASLKRAFQRLTAISDQLELAKQSAEHANNAKTQFITQVNHELRTPLQAIIGMLDLLRRGRLTRKQKQRVDLAHNASNDLRHLVDDLLDLSSVENGSPLIMNLEKTDIDKMARDCIQLMQHHAKRKKLHLYVVSEIPNDCGCLVDSYRLRQILINLIQNAIRYTSKGEVECRLWLDSDWQPQEPAGRVWLNIAVRDTGCGIAPENLDRIFQNFVRIHPQETTHSFGPRLGLGLPITASLVAAMQGAISVDSRIGQGSRFLIRLPTTLSDLPKKACGQTPIEPSCQPCRGKGNEALSSQVLTALVVDDSKVNRRLIREYLARLGIKTIGTNSLVRAKELYLERSPALVVLDLHLGDQTTLDLAGSIRATGEGENSLLYFITADSQFALEYCPVELDVAAILRKPIEFNEFRAALLPGLQSLNRHRVGHVSEELSEFDDLRSKLKRIVRQQLPDEMRKLNEAFDRSDFKTIQLIAHRLRGSAANAGWLEMADVFAKLESNPMAFHNLAETCQRIAIGD
jgi:signal transduction histidine kinase/DNA-binding response OmpR family regulator